MHNLAWPTKSHPSPLPFQKGEGKCYRIALVALLVMSAVACWGQGRWSLKPYSGLALSHYLGDEAKGCRMRPGVVAGVEACYRLTNYMSVSGAVEYVPRGSSIRPIDSYLRQDHLSVPILLHFHPFGHHIDMTLGVAPSFGLHSVMRIGGEHYNGDELFYSHDILVPLGVSYTLNNGLSFGARLSAGRKTMVLRDAIYHGEHYNLRGARMMNNELSFIIGYRLKL